MHIGARRLRFPRCPLVELETRLISEALAGSGGNQSEAARRLGISRVGLIKKIGSLGLRGEGNKPGMPPAHLPEQLGRTAAAPHAAPTPRPSSAK
ncbi:helix-turn-helix domain-containing protein [Ramlibacter tataouinensis]|uniref:helix-turn-helix domain-containing protein n=1 Tax=Ramlibacter tataouinensis TaxID=94132 RepID=UPI0009DA4940|nr:helix-turn-helix domain-containing protein [Ramlibacter tataouinensis]